MTTSTALQVSLKNIKEYENKSNCEGLALFLKDPNLMAHAELATAVCEALFVITERTISEKKLSESGVFEGLALLFDYPALMLQPEVVFSLCKVVSRFCFRGNISCQNQLRRARVCEGLAILFGTSNFMQKYQNVTIGVCDAIANMCSGGNSDNQNSFERLGVCDGTASLLANTTLMANGDVVAALCKVIVAMCYGNVNNQDKFGAIGVCEGVNNVLSALYKTNRKVCGVGSNCIYYLAKDNPTNQRRLRNAGALELMESICQISNIESGFYQNEALTLLKNYEPDLSFRPAQGKNVDLQAPSKVKSFVAPKVKSAPVTKSEFTVRGGSRPVSPASSQSQSESTIQPPAPAPNLTVEDFTHLEVSTEKSPSTSLPLTNFRSEVPPPQPEIYEAEVQEALEAFVEWGRSKIMIVGEGRAGKTAFANSLSGKEFTETESTMGIKESKLTCEVQMMTAAEGKDWEANYEEPEKIFENQVAKEVMKLKRDPERAQSIPGDRGRLLSAAKPAILEVQGNTYVPSESQNRVGKCGIFPKFSQIVSMILGTNTSNNGHTANSAHHVNGSGSTVSHEFSKLAPDLSTAQSSSIVPAYEVKPVNLNTVDEAFIIKVLAENVQIESNNKIILSMFDFGGQRVFNVIHPFFLTRFGVYVIVFNMELIISKDPMITRNCLSYIRFWMNSVAIHTSHKSADSAHGIKTAPVALVGTFKDKISNSEDHEKISERLRETFHDFVVWPHLIENDFVLVQGSESNIKRNANSKLVFFPVDNTKGRNDPVIKKLMRLIEKKIEESDYVHAKKPLGWLRVLDELNLIKGKGLLTVSLEEVLQVASKHGVPSGLTTIDDPLTIALQTATGFGVTAIDMLRFFHGVGLVMWHDELALRDTVILEPVAHFVAPATMVICKHLPTEGIEGQQVADNTVHSLPIHDECKKVYRRDFVRMTDQAIVSERLLKKLMEPKTQQYDLVRKMMIKYGLLVPLFESTQLDPSKKSYFVPSLLQEVNDLGVDLASFERVPIESVMWTFCFVFYVGEEQLSIGQKFVSDRSSLGKLGFLPTGLFERLIGKALAWSIDTCGNYDISSVITQWLKNRVKMYIGGQEFEMVECLDLNCITVFVEGLTPVAVHERLKEFIEVIIKESFRSLNFTTLIPYNFGSSKGTADSNLLFLNLAMVQDKVNENHREPLRLPGSTFVDFEVLEAEFEPWVEKNHSRPHYHVFLSYMWHLYDQTFVKKLRDRLSLHVLSSYQNCSITTFLDVDKLVYGEKLREAFINALINSTVIVPLFSFYPIERMLQHDPCKIDNVLLEWICAQICYAKRNLGTPSRVQYILPIALGKRINENALECDDLFGEGIIDKLPEIEPTETLKIAKELLFKGGVLASPDEDFNKYNLSTVKKIVKSLTDYKAIIPSSEYTKNSSVLEYCASEIQKIANGSNMFATGAASTSTTTRKSFTSQACQKSHADAGLQQLTTMIKELQENYQDQALAQNKLLNEMKVFLIEKDSTAAQILNQLVDREAQLKQKDETISQYQSEINSLKSEIHRRFQQNSSNQDVTSLILQVSCPGSRVPVSKEPSREADIISYLSDRDKVILKPTMHAGFLELINEQGFVNLAISDVSWSVLATPSLQVAGDAGSHQSMSNPMLLQHTLRPRTNSLTTGKGVSFNQRRASIDLGSAETASSV